ncbi:protein GrpE [Peptococcaceae bacterium CEB3]|nr:protein GrpE [Peptococcaceae bacterium CEB3]
MEWKFWSKQKNGLARIEEQMAQTNQRLGVLQEQLGESARQAAETSEQVRKLGRLQYKMGQDWQGKFEGLNSGLAAIREWQAVYAVDKPLLETLGRQSEYLAEFLLTWLDDLDLLTSHLHNNEQESWYQLLDKWTRQVVQALQILGLREIPLLGTSYDAVVAECIGTVERPEKLRDERDEQARISVPYEVAEVVKRGFILGNGKLKRKAQVIIYREDNKAGENPQTL